MGTPIRAADRYGFERAVAAMRGTLGDAAFVQAWTDAATGELDGIISDGLAAAVDVPA